MINYTLGKGGSGGAIKQWEKDGVYVSKGSMCTLTYKGIHVTVWPNYKGWRNVINMIDGQHVDCIKKFIFYNLSEDNLEELLDEILMDGFKRGKRAKLDEIRRALDL